MHLTFHILRLAALKASSRSGPNRPFSPTGEIGVVGPNTLRLHNRASSGESPDSGVLGDHPSVAER